VRKKSSSKSTTRVAIVRHVIEQGRTSWKAGKDRDAEAFRQLVADNGIMIFGAALCAGRNSLATMNSADAVSREMETK